MIQRGGDKSSQTHLSTPLSLLPFLLHYTNPFIFVPALADCLYKEDVSLEHIYNIYKHNTYKFYYVTQKDIWSFVEDMVGYASGFRFSCIYSNTWFLEYVVSPGLTRAGESRYPGYTWSTHNIFLHMVSRINQ